MSIEAAPIAGTAARLDRIIAANYGRLPSRDLARRLGMPTLRLIGHARRLGLLRPVTFTEAQRTLIRRHYRPDDPAAIAALVAVTGKPRWQVTREARCMGLSRRAPPRWTDADVAKLDDLWGRYPPAVVAKRLGRSLTACDLKARRLGLRTMNRLEGFTARQVARWFAVEEHKVTRQWIAHGWLAATRSRMALGPHRMWRIGEEALLRFLRDYRAEYRWHDMADPTGYYRKYAEQLAKADPLLTTAEVAARWGMTTSGVAAHIAKGWLPATKGHTNGNAGVWWIRQSDLEGRGPRRPELVGHKGRGKAGA